MDLENPCFSIGRRSDALLVDASDRVFISGAYFLKRPGGEMVYTRVLEARAVRRGGSSPLLGTSLRAG